MMRKKDLQLQDEELATIADEIIAGNLGVKLNENNELAPLVETMIRLESAFTNSEEEAIAKEKVYKALRGNPKILQVKEKSTTRKRFAFPIFDWLNQPQARLAVAFTALLLFVIAAPFFLTVPPDIAASAGAITSRKISALLLGIFVVIVLFWGLKRKP